MPKPFKYAPLGRYLTGQPPDVRELMLTLSEIERIIDAPLPRSARTWVAWSNSPRTTAHAWVWLDAGWRVRRLNWRLADPTVTFVRQVPP